ncbi:MAG: hypothetical protein M3552_22695 [Planctomycetota bacterium]|nr:hypothetical protein [Planctomycetaceae bacterium]MDQ3333418.1 hypothetical protein [Planctomycetota bacterium]
MSRRSGREADRLDGYLVFHTNELRAAVVRMEASLERDHSRRLAEPPLSKAG